ncbi:MAG: hypothetical protein WCJ96_10550 [Verrucomicrobiota bacterium]|jgi:hypothetical protein
MNYSSLLPVLQIVGITVLALIECAPARTGDQPVRQEAMEPKELPREHDHEIVRVGRAPRIVVAYVPTRFFGEHGYSSKLHLNSE